MYMPQVSQAAREELRVLHGTAAPMRNRWRSGCQARKRERKRARERVSARVCVRVEQALIYGLIWTGTGDWEWAALMACYTKSSIMLCCVVLVCVGYWESRNEQPGPGRDGVRARARS